MMSLLRFTIVVIFGVVFTSQNHDVIAQIPYGERPRQRSVEATTLLPPDPTVENKEIQYLLTRLEALCEEKLDFLITDTNRRFESLENQLSLLSSCPTSPVVQNYKNLEAKVENLGKSIEELLDTTRTLPSDMEEIKRNVSSLINDTRSLVDLSSNSELKQIFDGGLQDLKDLQTVTSISCQLNFTLDEPQYPRNCREVQESENTASGIYMIQPERAPKPFEVVCDLETRGGGWTVIQKRFDGSQDFYLGWEEYKKGFGNLEGELWLGLENIHLLTGFEMNELLIELRDLQSQNTSAFYSQFSIGSEVEGYPLNVLGAYSGDGNDSMTYHAGMKFITKDNNQDDEDQETSTKPHCARYYSGAWWFNRCGECNLNGKYFDRDSQEAKMRPVERIFWKKVHNIMKYTRILVRPIGEK